MDDKALIRVELAYASTDKQRLLSVEVVIGTTAREAILKSDLVSEFPDCDFSQCPLGIWGRPVSDDRCLADRDRVEAYRPLLHDPREVRRELALDGRSMGHQDSKVRAPGLTPAPRQSP